jgi:hypothetical protein
MAKTKVIMSPEENRSSTNFYNITKNMLAKSKKKTYKAGGQTKKELPKAKGGKWIQKVTASIKRRGTEGVCTGAKFGSSSCPPGSKRYNLAKTFKKMAKKK